VDITVRFTHPRKSNTYGANIDTQLTAKEAIEALLSPLTGPFLQPAPLGQEYLLVLRRTSTLILSNMTMDTAGVKDNDILEVVFKSSAARFPFTIKLKDGNNS
jgi:hypothetical protein